MKNMKFHAYDIRMARVIYFIRIYTQFANKRRVKKIHPCIAVTRQALYKAIQYSNIVVLDFFGNYIINLHCW